MLSSPGVTGDQRKGWASFPGKVVWGGLEDVSEEMFEPGSVAKKFSDIGHGKQGILSFQGSKGPIRSTCQKTVGTERVKVAFLLAFPLRASLCQDLGLGKGQRHPDGLWERKGELSQLQFIWCQIDFPDKWSKYGQCDHSEKPNG